MKRIVQDRNWHQGKIEHRLAAMTKTNLSRGRLSYEKACEILKLLGWEKVKDETWEHEGEGEGVEEKPVLVGKLKKREGINGYNPALPGHPVYELKDRYLIYLSHPSGREIIVSYYKETLRPCIEFFPAE